MQNKPIEGLSKPEAWQRLTGANLEIHAKVPPGEQTSPIAPCFATPPGVKAISEASQRGTNADASERNRKFSRPRLGSQHCEATLGPPNAAGTPCRSACSFDSLTRRLRRLANGCNPWRGRLIPKL